jgi:hypothetical protein
MCQPAGVEILCQLCKCLVPGLYKAKLFFLGARLVMLILELSVVSLQLSVIDWATRCFCSELAVAEYWQQAADQLTTFN